ncbi:sulfur metabolite repression control protein [Colletotrichum truncatum]|uniref:Sulfur metabolite repression control protein n=1 Tax=Colletotrichum truncatum TaxID=5467 RepID=A0ACC3YKV8_COLTU|nr:sulfur metabolite repression control protein [Colletotrichum truncatum]KAF6783432.1 sulfur metabolite repression control protein [Colletotrichum truncatum]
MDLASTSTVPDPRSMSLNLDLDLSHPSPSSPSRRRDELALTSTPSPNSFITTPTFTAATDSPSTSKSTYTSASAANDVITATQPPTKDNCDRRRLDEGDNSRFPANMPTQLVGQTVTPFLREHIPGIYAPIGKPDVQNENNNLSQKRDPNSKYCYRHRPDAKCRRAADESKMVLIQSELDKLPVADQQAITHVWSLFSAAPAKHRDLMLQGIITQCCFPQLSTVSREVHEQLKIDFMAALPTEISYKVLGYLDTVSLCKAAQVSRRWRDLADDDVVWHRMCEQHIDRKCTKCGFGLPLLERKRLRDWNKQKELARSHGVEEPAEQPQEAAAEPASSPNANKKRELVVLDDSRKRSCLSEVGEPGAPKAGSEKERDRLIRPWKSVYRDRFKVGYNWKYGRCHIKTFKGHDNGVTCLQFDDDILATGSYDAKIKIWNIETGEEIRTLSGHTMGIRTLKFVGNKLFSGSLDHTIKVWNWQTGDCISTLRCHTEGVISVDFDGKFLASGSIDKSVKIFNFDSKETFCLRGHEDWVNHVRLDPGSQTVFSASDDCTVRLWDLRNKTCIKTFEGHMGQVQQILLMPEDFEPDEELLTGDNTDTASVHSGSGRARSTTPSACANVASILGSSFGDSTSAEDERSSFGSAFASDPTRQLPPRYMLTAGLDNTVKVWNTATGKCLRTMFGHVEGIWGLVGDTLRVVTGANDSMVKVWEPKSGKCERTFTGHSGPVTCVGLSDSRMASGSEDGEVRLYSFEADGPLEECGTPA